MVHVGLQLAMFAAHTMAAAWLLLARLDLVFDPLAATTSVARWAVLAWALAGVVWTPLNARGLWRRRAWARRSTMAYWAMPMSWCCCIPLPAWALWTLTRPAMRDLLDER